MTSSKLNTIEAIMLVFTIVVAHTLLSLQRNILALTKSATLLNLIYVSIIAILITYFIYKLISKFPGLDILDISDFLGGKILKSIVGIIFIAFFTISSSILLRSFCESLKIIYFPLTNIIYIILLFIIALCFSNRLGFTATLKTNALILPIVFVSIVFLLFTNIKNFKPQGIFPILGDGIFNTFGVGLLNLYSFGGIAYLYFLPPLLKEPKNTKKIFLMSTVICAIYIFLCVSILLFMFSFFINTNEIVPLYNATRYIEFGDFFQRLESIFLLLWILAFACYLSICTKFNILIFRKITNIKAPEILVDIFAILTFAIAVLPENSAVSQLFEKNIYPYLVLGIIFAFSIAILVFAYFKQKSKSKNLKGATINA